MFLWNKYIKHILYLDEKKKTQKKQELSEDNAAHQKGLIGGENNL